MMSEDEATFDIIIPNSGFCLKTQDDKRNKVFLNVCTSDLIPDAPVISDDALLVLLESDKPGDFRIPMCLGEPHVEYDNNGCRCNAYDIIVSKKLFSNLEQRRVLMTFFLTVLLEGIEGKYNLQLDREWKILKNRKSFGNLQEQNIRRPSKPLIEEIKNWIEPKYEIKKVPSIGEPNNLTVEIQLPNVESADSISLDLGEDRLILEEESNSYFMDIFLPYNTVQGESSAQFNKKTKILLLNLPVKV